MWYRNGAAVSWREKQALSAWDLVLTGCAGQLFVLFLPWISTHTRNCLNLLVSFSVTFNVLISGFGKFLIMYKRDFSYCKLLNKIKLVSAWLLGILICLCSVPFWITFYLHVAHYLKSVQVHVEFELWDLVGPLWLETTHLLLSRTCSF